MKRKIIIAIYIIIILIALKLIYNIAIDSILISKYNSGEYNETYVKALSFVNFPQGYIANYNYGNVLYKNGEYEGAIEKYKQALNGIIPKYEECKIRINYALSICKTVQVDEKDKDSINDAIEIYESAIEILTEKGCANIEDDNGHSKEAEQLKKDIQKEIDRLKKLTNSKDEKDKEKDKDNKNEKEKNKDKETETIETKIQEIKTNAMQEQREKESQYKNYGNYSYDKIDRNW